MALQGLRAKTRIFFEFFGGFGGRYKVEMGWEWVKNNLLCSCRQPPAEIRDFSGHPKSANPDFDDFGSKLTHFEQNPP